MNHLLRAVTVSAALLGSACGAWAADSPEGNWRTIDDRSGFAKALVRIVKEADGTSRAPSPRPSPARITPRRIFATTARHPTPARRLSA